MREYLPLLFEALIAGAVLVWGTRELILLRKDDTKENEDNAE